MDKPVSSARLLITGVPATGKTTLGDHLRDSRGFLHLNFEDQNSWPAEARRPAASLADFVAQLERTGRPVVITWGFKPGSPAEAMVRELQGHGYKLIWLDGNREAARREFIKRNELLVVAGHRPIPSELLDLQMARIDRLDVDSFGRPLLFRCSA